MTDSSPPHIDLADLGFCDFFSQALDGSCGIPARIVRDGRDLWHVLCERGPFVTAISGKFRYEAGARVNQPAVGDWVLVETKGPDDRALIHRVLPRKTAIARKVPGNNMETQVVAANVDTAFIVNALDGGRNFNPRRIERYLSLVRESGAAPVLVLNKCDLCADPQAYEHEVRALAPDVPVLLTCALSGRGVNELRALLQPGHTCVMLGPSGVGKSALVNQLLGNESQQTGEVRARDRRGRHTTTFRELLRLPDRSLVIDTPGLREIQLWAGEGNLSEVFPDIEEWAGSCRFTDCRHDKEPGCAVRAALEDGRLAPRRFESYTHLRGEIEALVEQQHRHRQRVERRHRRILQQDVDANDAPQKGSWE